MYPLLWLYSMSMDREQRLLLKNLGVLLLLLWKPDGTKNSENFFPPPLASLKESKSLIVLKKLVCLLLSLVALFEVCFCSF